MKVMIGVKERDCPSCGRPKAEAVGSFECPECHKGLCTLCWITIPDNDGNSVRCPHCGKEISLVKSEVVEED